MAFLIPTLHTDLGLNLALAGLISAMPKFGMVPTGLTPPLFGAVIGAAGYPVAFAVCTLFPILAVPLVPRDPG